MRRPLAYLFVAVACIASPAAGSSVPDSLHITSVRAFKPEATAARRSPVVVDPIEAMLVNGDGQFSSVDDTEWHIVNADEDGWLRDDALAGGYAFAEFENDSTPTVRILRARGARHVYANGEPHAGDFYNLDILDVPIRIREGTNRLLFRGARSAVRASLVSPPAAAYLSTRDLTLCSVIRGDSSEVVVGVVLINATSAWRSGLRVISDVDGSSTTTAVQAMPPTSVRKIAARFRPLSTDADSVRVTLRLHDDATLHHELNIVLPVHELHEKHVRSFVSDIDGSAQHYAVTPPPNESAEQPGLVLTLHGAGVRGSRQSHHYQPREWAVIVSPTNRREFGFDWEDWGRRDALEVLEDARSRYQTAPLRTWLTGHSMGGHGTWNLGAHMPDKFGAIAPSAGWRDFWTYSGAGERDSTDVVSTMVGRSANGSRTLLMVENLTSPAVYILHGENDQSVPVDEARAMRAELGAFHTNWVYYERPGAGHWWGDQCMDWPPLMNFLRDNPLPPPPGPREVRFTTVNPAVSPSAFWVRVQSQGRSLEPSRVHAIAAADSSRIAVVTHNVEHLTLDPTGLIDPPVDVVIDGDSLDDVSWTPDMPIHLFRSEGRWTPSLPPSVGRKSPDRAGPFKEAFLNRPIFVVGTIGTAAENAWALAKATYDAEVWLYRGNGCVEIVRDIDVRDDTHRNRNVILYGHAEMNDAWSRVLTDDCPIDVKRNSIRVGSRQETGETLACLFTFPRAGSRSASVGIIAGTGIAGLRLTHQLPYFVSGVGYPDWTVLDVSMLTDGYAGVRGAGFFNSEWALGEDFAWR